MKRITAFLALATLFAPAALHAEKTSLIDPAALAPLKRMSATLAAAKAFTYQSNAVLEVLADNGQSITLFSSGDVALKRPDKLRARLGGDAPAFDFYYDGKVVSAYAPETKVYSSTKAPATIDDMLSGLQEETGIRFATAPLFYTDPYASFTRDLISAMVVGTSTIGGTRCDHLAFQSPGVHWEIWIEANTRALPRRLAVTFTDQPNAPRTLVDLSGWDLNPWFLSDKAFTFHPPAGTKKIPFVSVWKAADR